MLLRQHKVSTLKGQAVQRVGNYTKESKCKRRGKPPRWKWEKTIQYNDITLPHFKEPDEWVGEKGQVSLLKSLLLLSAPWSVQRDSSLSSSFLWDQVRQNNFAWKMQGWLHPGALGLLWAPSVFERLHSVLGTQGWLCFSPLASANMTVTIFLVHQKLWELEKLEFSEHSDKISFQPGQSDTRAGRLIPWGPNAFLFFHWKSPRQAVLDDLGKGPWLFQRRTLCFKSCAFGVEEGGCRVRGGGGVGFCCLCI